MADEPRKPNGVIEQMLVSQANVLGRMEGKIESIEGRLASNEHWQEVMSNTAKTHGEAIVLQGEKLTQACEYLHKIDTDAILRRHKCSEEFRKLGSVTETSYNDMNELRASQSLRETAEEAKRLLAETELKATQAIQEAKTNAALELQREQTKTALTTQIALQKGRRGLWFDLAKMVAAAGAAVAMMRGVSCLGSVSSDAVGRTAVMNKTTPAMLSQPAHKDAAGIITAPAVDPPRVVP